MKSTARVLTSAESLAIKERTIKEEEEQKLKRKKEHKKNVQRKRKRRKKSWVKKKKRQRENKATNTKKSKKSSQKLRRHQWQMSHPQSQKKNTGHRAKKFQAMNVRYVLACTVMTWPVLASWWGGWSVPIHSAKNGCVCKLIMNCMCVEYVK